EFRAVHQYLGRNPDAINPVFVALTRALAPAGAPGVRIGGNSSDQTWWPVRHAVTPAGVTYALTKGWMGVTHALAAALGTRALLPRVPIAGPAFAGLTWMADLDTFLSAEHGLSLVTFHRYPLRGCVRDVTSPDYASIPNLLSDTSSSGLAQQVTPPVSTAHG